MKFLSSPLSRPTAWKAYRYLSTPFTLKGLYTSNSGVSRALQATKHSIKVTNESYSAIPIDTEKKTVRTPIGELPLSPMMDPSFHEAKQRFKKPKPRISPYKPTKFQRHLVRNPYGTSTHPVSVCFLATSLTFSSAQALATPIRICPITSTRLPKFFLQRFNLVSHPETNQPYFVPQDLDSKAPQNVPHKDLVTNQSSDEDEGEVSPALHGGENVSHCTRTGPSAYVLASQKLMQELERESSPYNGAYKKLLRMSSTGQVNLTKVLNTSIWRPDMHGVVLELMRRRIVEGLVYFAGMVETQGRKYITKLGSWDEVGQHKHRGCVLFLGLPNDRGASSGAEFVPPRLSTMDFPESRFGKKLAVHNLQVLLGSEHLDRLRSQSALLRGGSLFLLGRQATVKLQMLLWKLQGYMVWNMDELSGQPRNGEPKKETTS